MAELGLEEGLWGLFRDFLEEYAASHELVEKRGGEEEDGEGKEGGNGRGQGEGQDGNRIEAAGDIPRGREQAPEREEIFRGEEQRRVVCL